MRRWASHNLKRSTKFCNDGLQLKAEGQAIHFFIWSSSIYYCPPVYHRLLYQTGLNFDHGDGIDCFIRRPDIPEIQISV